MRRYFSLCLMLISLGVIVILGFTAVLYMEELDIKQIQKKQEKIILQQEIEKLGYYRTLNDIYGGKKSEQ